MHLIKAGALSSSEFFLHCFIQLCLFVRVLLPEEGNKGVWSYLIIAREWRGRNESGPACIPVSALLSRVPQFCARMHHLFC